MRVICSSVPFCAMIWVGIYMRGVGNMSKINIVIHRKQIVILIMLILCSLLLLVGDLASPTAYEDDSYLTPIPEKTRQAFDIQAPITNKLQAAIAGQILGTTPHFRFVSTPVIRSVEEMSLAQAREKLPGSGADDRPLDTKVWLVIMQVDVQIIPPPSLDYQTMTPTPSIIHDSCSYALIEAQDPSNRLQLGGIDCPSQ